MDALMDALNTARAGNSKLKGCTNAPRSGTELTIRQRLMIAAALQWFLECVKSGQPYDMSHLTLGDKPLSDDEIEKLRQRIAIVPRLDAKQFEDKISELASNFVFFHEEFRSKVESVIPKVESVIRQYYEVEAEAEE
jgi:hypothetical protein